MQKLKVVWVCHFSNEDVRERLPVSGSRVLSFVKHITGKGDTGSGRDFAPWISNMITWFEKFEDIELHIVAPCRGLMRLKYEFEMRGIFYHFFRSDLPFAITQIAENVIPTIHNYFLAKYNVKRLIDKINPDIVNFIGAENAYYSSTILGIKKYPVLVTLQTVYANPDRAKYSSVNKLAWNNELKIFAKEKFYAASNKIYRDLVIGYHPGATVFKFSYPFEFPKIRNVVPKLFDFVFFSISLSKKKGADDAIEAFALLCKDYPDASLHMIGGETPERMEMLRTRIKEIGLEKNIKFLPSFEIQSDLFDYIVKGRFALLPVKLDFIPGTILQSMCLGLPVITYATSGTPTLNNEKECVLIAEMENVRALAENMKRLMGTPELGETLKTNSFEFINEHYDNKKAMRRVVENYWVVLDHYKNGTPVPEELLHK